MPTWDNDNIWLRLCDRFRYRSHIDAQETVCIEPAARCRRLKNTVRIPVCEADVPVEGFTEADTLLIGQRSRCVQHREVELRTSCGDIAEERRHVLHRMGLDEGDSPAHVRQQSGRTRLRVVRPGNARTRVPVPLG